MGRKTVPTSCLRAPARPGGRPSRTSRRRRPWRCGRPRSSSPCRRCRSWTRCRRPRRRRGRGGRARRGCARRTRPARRRVVEGVDVGEQHERVGVDEMGHEGGEPVVVAEADLARRDGVVLVDDGHDAEVEQPLEGAAGVGVVGPTRHVVGGEQHLPTVMSWPRRPGVGGEEGALTDGGRRLLRRQVARPRAEPRGWMPAAIAPELTRTIWVPPRCWWARASTRATSRASSRPPSVPVRELEPTLTTSRRAVLMTE